jgi:hypothetical protein
MPLEEWLAEGHLKRQPGARAEIARLLAVVDRDLADASVHGTSVDRRFATAYGAALGLAAIVLRASGYRTAASGGGHHWRTIALLPELMGLGQSARRAYLDSCRRARNAADYDRVDVASDGDLRELLEDTLTFRSEVLDWLHSEHPGLV